MAFDKNTVVTGFLTRLTTRVSTDAAPASHVGSTGAAHGVASTTTNGFMSSIDKTKLDGLSNYTLPVASTTTLGGVKAGTNISIDANGVISANDASVGWSEITSKPTTLAGYGITDAAALKGTDTVYGGAKFSLSGTTLTITTI